MLDCLEDIIDEMDKALVVGLSSGDEILFKRRFLGLQQNVVPHKTGIIASRHLHFGHGIGIDGRLKVIFQF